MRSKNVTWACPQNQYFLRYLHFCVSLSTKMTKIPAKTAQSGPKHVQNIHMTAKRVVLGRLRAVFARTWICVSSRRVLAPQGVKWTKSNISVSRRMSVTFYPMDVFGRFLLIFCPFCSFCSFLLLEPIFDCMKVSGVVPEQFPGSSDCFRVHLIILGL